MKKLLIASAALAIVAGTAQAQSVTLYGSIDSGYSDVQGKVTTQATGNTVTTTNSGIAQSSDSSSRWGIRGSEDLGGGMKANFNLESGLGTGTNGALNGNTDAAGAFAGPATGSAQIGGRAMWVSVSTAGGFEVRGGLQDQFIRTMSTTYNADGTTNVVGNLLAGNGAFAGRHNAISATQTMGALKFGAAVTGRSTEVTNAADIDAGKGYELMAQYASGPLSVGGAMRKTDTSAAAVTAAAKLANTVAANGLVADQNMFVIGDFADTAATSVETETMSLGASYNFGPVRGFLGYATQDVQDQLVVGAGKAQREVTTIGVNGNVGKTQLFATYSMGETTAANLGAVSRDIDGYVVGARYNLSKRTHAYAIYGTSDVAAGNNAVATTTTKTTQMAFGLNHKF